MNKIIKFLILYTALINTSVLIILLLSLKTTSETSQELTEGIKNLNQAAEKLSSDTSGETKSNEDLDKIKKDIEALREEEIKKVLGVNESPLPDQNKALGYIKITDPGYKTLDTYSQASFSSPVAGKINAGENYGYTKKEGSWYLIQLPGGLEGWANSRFVKETGSQQ